MEPGARKNDNLGHEEGEITRREESERGCFRGTLYLFKSCIVNWGEKVVGKEQKRGRT